MVLRKNSHYRLITQFLTVIFIVFSSACKKLDKDNPIEFNIKAHIPYNDEPIAFVKYTIREYKAKNGINVIGDKEYTHPVNQK